MNSTHVSLNVQAPFIGPLFDPPTPRLDRSFRRQDRPKALQENARRAMHAPRHLDEGLGAYDRADEHGPLELATRTFRYLREREYRRKAAVCRASLRETKDAYAELVAHGGGEFADVTTEIHDLEGSVRWYEGRAGAQLPRFATVAACGTQSIRVNCRACSEDLCLLACKCGVVRVCDACAQAKALQRQKRIAAARIDALIGGQHANLFFRKRHGGAFTEKMLTLTAPHIELADLSGAAAEACEGFGLATTVNARIAVLRLAWPRFIRRVRRHLKKHDPIAAEHFAFYRLWEWTRGGDQKGHPHFHVYLFSPFLPRALLRSWWGDALEQVGCPKPETPIIDIKRLYGFNGAALAELVKAGDRRAIEKLGTLELKTPGLDAIRYASAWSLADAFKGLEDASSSMLDVRRDLYCALEGRRLAQGSRGFLVPIAAPSCACCGAHVFSAKVLDFDHPASARAATSPPREERGPPHESN